ncbi:putative Ig domain-containing protein [Subtercola endophyticus]|uniref:putative Ig domain-containing protein n=1 Tax=Subtercola endophyticus TaxID=2895559 RepID=UPI001E62F721|nr:putative Ig domain-containing protein [Subtercola endophyticus]UFS58591.1 putative Ig domain-containing protein [Subtercola endophyticus]
MLYVANYTAGSVVKIDSSKSAGANIVTTFSLAPDARPMGIAVDSRDNVYVSESGTNEVALIPAGSTSAPATIMTLASNAGASGIAVSSTNEVLVTGFGSGTVSSLDLAPAITTATVPDTAVGVAYSSSIAGTGVDPLGFNSDDLPAWLHLDGETGALTGTPTTAGPVSFTVILGSPAGPAAVKEFSFTVNAAATGGPGGSTGAGGSGGAGGSAGTGSGGSAATGGGAVGANSTGITTGAATLAHTGASASTALVTGGAAAVVLLAGLLLAGIRRRLNRA